MTPDSDVGWLLVEAAGPCLTCDQRTIVFVELGCGENHRAIERILTAVAETDFPLPLATRAVLQRWLDLYLGSPEERRLQSLLAEIQSK